MNIATWNVNSLKVRLPHLLEWLGQNQPDIIALQETKLVDAQFPQEAIRDAGYNVVFSGQPTYNGVALLAKHTIDDAEMAFPDWADPQKRLIAATIKGIRIINVYVPNGAAVDSDKYQYKMAWLDQLHRYTAQQLKHHPRLIMLGDFNIAPKDEDVHDPAAWQGQVLVSPDERKHFFALLDLGLQDTFRLFDQPPKIYSWWDYRMLAFRRNHGLRIDHILASEAMAATCQHCIIDKAPRKQERPSDHTPVVAEFK